MQTYTPFNWNNTFTPFAQNFGGFNPWSVTPGFNAPQNWNTFPGYQNWQSGWNNTPWFGASPMNSSFQTWNRPFAGTPWNTQPFNGFENTQPWSNWTPTWNTPFNASWFQPTTNWFNAVPFGYYPGANFNQPFNAPVNQSSYPFSNYAGGNYPYPQHVPTNAPVYPTVGHPCRDAA